MALIYFSGQILHFVQDDKQKNCVIRPYECSLLSYVSFIGFFSEEFAELKVNLNNVLFEPVEQKVPDMVGDIL